MNTKMKNMLVAGLMVLSTGISITALDQETARIRELRALYASGNLNRAQYPTKNGDTVQSDEALLEKNNMDMQAEIQSSKNLSNIQSQVSVFLGCVGAATAIVTVVGCYMGHRFLTKINLEGNIKRKGKNIVMSVADSVGWANWGFIEKAVDYIDSIKASYAQVIKEKSARSRDLAEGLFATTTAAGITAVSVPMAFLCRAISAKNSRLAAELNKSFDQNLAILGRLKTVKAGL